MNELIKHAAVVQWMKLTASQKAVVRFGMIPIETVDEVKTTLGDVPDFHRLFAVAMMDCAKHDGGMVA